MFKSGKAQSQNLLQVQNGNIRKISVAWKVSLLDESIS